MKIPNPNSEPRTYIVEKDGKLCQRTREHLRPRPVHQETSDRKLHPMPTFTLEPNQFPNLKIKPSTPITQEPVKPETATQGKAGEPSTHPSQSKQYHQQGAGLYTTRYGRTVKPPAKHYFDCDSSYKNNNNNNNKNEGNRSINPYLKLRIKKGYVIVRPLINIEIEIEIDWYVIEIPLT